MSQSNKPAFPYVVNPAFETKPGLTKREYIASQIFGDLLCDEMWKDEISGVHDFPETSVRRIAKMAVIGADALIVALSEPVELSDCA